MKNNTLTTLSILLIGLLLVALGFFGATLLGGRSGSSFTPGFLFGAAKNEPTQASSKEVLPLVLSQAQKDALIKLGIDPARAPSSISPAQQDCFIANLGEEKFATIKNGGVPSVMDYMKVKSCL